MKHTHTQMHEHKYTSIHTPKLIKQNEMPAKVYDNLKKYQLLSHYLDGDWGCLSLVVMIA